MCCALFAAAFIGLAASTLQAGAIVAAAQRRWRSIAASGPMSVDYRSCLNACQISFD